MPEPTDVAPLDPADTLDDVVLTEAGAISREEFKIRQAADTAASEVSEVELLERRRQEILEETAPGAIETGIGRAASAAFFGATDLLSSEESREESRRGIEAHPTAAFAGEVFGGVVPTVLSGGAGIGGSLARLSPSGQLAANVARWTSGSKTLAGRAVRSTAGAGLEGGVEFMGNAIANEALQENPQFSAEALASDFGLGAVVGGGISAVSSVLGAGLRRAKRARETPGTALGRLADDSTGAFDRQLADGPAGGFERRVSDGSPESLDRRLVTDPGGQRVVSGRSLADTPTAPGVVGRGARGKASATATKARRPASELEEQLEALRRAEIEGTGKPTFDLDLEEVSFRPPTIELGDVVGRGARGKADNAYRDLVTHIDDAGTKSFGAATQTTGRLTSQLDELGLPDAIAMDLKTSLKEVSSQYVDAGTRARRWISDASDELGIPPSQITAKKLNELSPDVEDRGIAALSELDEAQGAWQRASSEVDAGVADTLSGAGQPSGGLIANASARFGGMAKRIRAGNIGTAIGVAEGARDLGIDVPLPSVRDIPLVGDALSLFTKMKALSRATGMVPATKATRAAQSVTSTRDRVGSAIKQAGRTAARIAAKPIVRNVTARSARAVAREILEVRNTTPADVEASAHESIDAPMEIKQAAVATAVRAHQYLSDVAPVNPLAGTAAASSWVPTAQDQLDWTTRRNAVQNPNRAIRESMAGGFPDLAVEALREVYPALYEDTRSRLQQDANKLNKRLPPHQLQAIGRVYRVPLTLSQTDGYGAAVQASFAQGQANDREAVDRFATRQKALRPVNPGTSAVSALTESPLQRLSV